MRPSSLLTSAWNAWRSPLVFAINPSDAPVRRRFGALYVTNLQAVQARARGFGDEGKRGEGLFQLVELLAFEKLFHDDAVGLFVPAVAQRRDGLTEFLGAKWNAWDNSCRIGQGHRRNMFRHS